MRITKRVKWIAPLLIIVSLMGFVACQPKLKPEADCNFVMSSQIQRVSWKSQLPVKLYISSSIPVELRESIRVAAAQWNYKLSREALIILESGNVPASPNKDGINAIYYQPTWDPNKINEQARTTIHWKGDSINEADVLINAHNHEFTAFGILEPGKVDFTSLMVHEFGHVMGLQHIQGQESVMAPTLASNTERSVPYENDVNSLKCEYN